MKTQNRSGGRLLLPCLLLQFFPASTSVGSDEGDWKTIFDGQTLKGWKVTPAEYERAWSVKNGVIHGNGDKGRCYLEYENRELADFELRLEYRFPGKGNSGISIRAVPDPTGRRKYQSYHADLGHVGIGKQILGAWDFHTPGRKEHACFRGDRLVIGKDDRPTLTKIEDAISLAEIKKKGWNRVHIIARGNHFRFLINGKMAAEFIEHLPIEKRLQRGALQLQLHDPGMIVEFRKIQLKISK